jgi:predicted permease
MRFEHWFFSIPHRVRSIVRRDRVEAELQEELEFHLEQRVKQEVERGKTLDEARREALRAMDGLEQRKEECRDARAVNGLENVMQDVRYAARGLRNKPWFTTVAVLTLALGIGANSAIFSVINAALLKPLPYPKPEQLVLLFETVDGAPNVVSYANFSDWEQQARSFSAMSAGRQNTFTLGSSGAIAPERIEGGIYSWALFETLGVHPILGRAFMKEDNRTGAARVAVISYDFWQERFGGNGDVLIRKVRLDGVNCDIIGVMPQGFGYPTRAVKVWTPIRALYGDTLTERSWHQLYVLARLSDGANVKAATAEVETAQRRIHAQFPASQVGTGATSLPLRDITTFESRTSLYVLLGAVGCLLLIACVNVSNLLIARASQRQREFSVRAALGAGRGRLIQQLLTESLLLAVAGSIAGLLVGYAMTSLLGAHAALLIRAYDIDTSAPVRLDGRVFAFTMMISVVAGLAAGLFPARRFGKADLTEGLKEGGRSATAGHGQQRLRAGLISAEVALSLMLLIMACLMIRSFAELRGVQPGMRTKNVLTAAISVPDSRYGPEAVSRFSKTLLERAKALPGVKAAALVNCVPVGGYCGDDGFSIEGRALPQGQFYNALDRSASPGYWETAGIPLLAGRDFTERDGRGFDAEHPRTSALIISASMARKWWPDGHALGKRVYFGDDKSPRYEVIGIVGDVLIDLEKTPQPTMYTPQLEGRNSDFYLVLRTEENSAGYASSIKQIVRGIDPEVPAFQVRTMDEILGQSSKTRGFTAILLGSFATLALVLSAVGLYGVLSYLIAQRTAEIGIRMALGASRIEVFRLALFEGMRPTFAGLVIGLVAAAGLGRLIQSTLFAVKATDLATFLLAALMLLLMALVASLVPIRRATNVDPINALRSE